MDRSAFFATAGKRRFAVVADPDGNMPSVRIQSLTTQEMRSVRDSLTTSKGELNRKRSERIKEFLICRCVVDDDGSRVFSDDDAFSGVFDDVDGRYIEVLFNAARRHTGFNTDEDWIAIEGAIKNSEDTAEADSSGD